MYLKRCWRHVFASNGSCNRLRSDGKLHDWDCRRTPPAGLPALSAGHFHHPTSTILGEDEALQNPCTESCARIQVSRKQLAVLAWHVADPTAVRSDENERGKGIRGVRRFPLETEVHLRGEVCGRWARPFAREAEHQRLNQDVINRSVLGKFNAIRYEAFLFNDVIYKREARLFVWISDDARRLPVQIQVRMKFHIGTVTLQLDKVEP